MQNAPICSLRFRCQTEKLGFVGVSIYQINDLIINHFKGVGKGEIDHDSHSLVNIPDIIHGICPPGPTAEAGPRVSVDTPAYMGIVPASIGDTTTQHPSTTNPTGPQRPMCVMRTRQEIHNSWRPPVVTLIKAQH